MKTPFLLYGFAIMPKQYNQDYTFAEFYYSIVKYLRQHRIMQTER